MTKYLILMFTCANLVALPAFAEIYRWVDQQGTVHYSDRKAKNAESVELPGLQSLGKTATPGAKKKSLEVQDNASKTSVTLTRPLPDETFRDGRGLVTAQAAVSPRLAPEEKLIYYLDGNPAPPAPTRSTFLQLQGVQRGEHQLSVALVVGDKEISRSAPVVFFMKPPSALSAVSQNAPRPTEEQPTGAVTAPPTTRAPGALAAPRFGTNNAAAGQ